MRFSRLLVAGIVFLASTPALAQAPSYPNVGRTPTKEEIQAWDIAVGPDGKGLPPGQGTAKEGAAIFAAKCASCHGSAAEGGKIGPGLVGSKTDLETLTTLRPVRSIGGYWAFATTVWDYINRAMPRNQGGSLRADEVYALTAFILSKNGIIQESDVLNAKTLPRVQMPNRYGFIPQRFEDIPDERKRGCRQGVCP
jgi:mono/diheme cytochrome c family protein